jgi:hypothetical protein
MAEDTQYGCTLFIDDLKGGIAEPIERISLSKKEQESVDYDEAWLQRLIMKHPRLLPVDQIERAFAGLVPVCTELEVIPTRAYLDAFLVTPRGDLALIECKLWRNPEARREVVGQIIDYAKDFSTWDYQRLEAAVKRSKAISGGEGGKPRSLYEVVSPSNELDEASFIDAVSRNLKRGRFLLLIVGDGIREGVESMTEFLQQYAGIHFTLAVVELALFKVPTGGYIAQPRVLARTTNIDRGTVTVDEGGRITIRPSIAAPLTATNAATRMTITKENYLEQIDTNFPGLSSRLNEFIGKLEMYGVIAQFGVNSMILKWPDETKSWNLGVIPSSGVVFLDYLSAQALNGFRDILIKYVGKLAALVPGAYVKPNSKGTAWSVAQNGRCVTVDALLADETRQEGWLEAIAEFQAGVRKSSQGDSGNDDRRNGATQNVGKGSTPPEIVVEVGAEGGSITLLREPKEGGGWQFKMNVNDMFSEENRESMGAYVAPIAYGQSFHDGMALLDRYPWFRLVPLVVNPEFLDGVLLEVRKRGGIDEEIRWKSELRMRGEDESVHSNH